MKKIATSLFSLLAALGAFALTVSPAVKIETDGPVHNPVLSPDGNTLLFSTDNHTGLKALNLVDRSVITLDEISYGAGFNPVFSNDGKSVIFQTADLIDGLLNRDVRSYDLVNHKTHRLAPMSRENVNLSQFSGNADYVLATTDGIIVNKGGNTVSISPVSDAHSYLWASISPDGTKVLFNEPFQGVFVSDLDGNNLVKVASKGDFPAWAGDNLVTFTESHDDGYVILDSTLRIHDLTTGITVNLTPGNIKVGESASAPDGTVVYTTLDGALYQINVK